MNFKAIHTILNGMNLYECKRDPYDCKKGVRLYEMKKDPYDFNRDEVI